MRIYPHCKLNPCGLCGRLGGPHRVSYRSDVFSWNFTGPKDFSTEVNAVLCMGCWNRARAIVAMKDEAQEIGYLARKLLREVAVYERQKRRDEADATAGD